MSAALVAGKKCVCVSLPKIDKHTAQEWMMPLQVGTVYSINDVVRRCGVTFLGLEEMDQRAVFCIDHFEPFGLTVGAAP